jgi:hypothetical protein
MTAGEDCQMALADESGMIRNFAEAVGLPPTTQRHSEVS